MVSRLRPTVAFLLALGIGNARALPAQVHPGSEQKLVASDSVVLSDQVVDEGRKIFHGSGTCHACHGQQLQGGPIAPSLRGPKWRHIDGSFTAILHRVREGLAGTLMVSHPGDISDAQTIQVATYVWAVSRGKAKP
jgi:mono/diheme cytochrome c family protein